MRTKSGQLLSGISILICDIAICVLIIDLLSAMGAGVHTQIFWQWSICLILQYLLSELLLQKINSVNIYIIFHTIATAATCILLCMISFATATDHLSMGTLLFCGCIGAGTHAGIAVIKPTDANTLSSFTDFLIVVLAFYIWAVYGQATPNSVELIVFACCALVLNLFAINSIRTSDSEYIIQGAGLGVKLIVILIAAGCILLTGAVVGFASGQVHSMVDLLLAILNFICSIINAIFGVIGSILGAIILFFWNLFPSSDTDILYDNDISTVYDTETIGDTASSIIPAAVIYGILIALIVGLCIYILYMLRGKKFTLSVNKPVRRRFTKKSHLLSAIIAFIRGIISRISYEYSYIKYRHTPEGLYLCLVRRLRRHKLKRNNAESPGAFVRRISTIIKEPDKADILIRLANLLDMAYYTDQSPKLSASEYSDYLSAINTLGL